jgi:hypothetical protein
VAYPEARKVVAVRATRAGTVERTPAVRDPGALNEAPVDTTSAAGGTARSSPFVALLFFPIGPDRIYLGNLLEAVRAAAIPAGTTTYAGTYGPNREVANDIVELRNGSYALPFSIRPSTSRWAYAGANLLTPEERATVDPRFLGPVPRASATTPLPARDQARWGVELGRRFRDQLRRSRERGIPVATWQFDELVYQLVGGSLATRSQYFVFTTGILEGLHNGRPGFDRPEQGIVWAARSTLLRLPTVPITATTERFWRGVNDAAFAYVGEEYMDFAGSAKDSAVRWSAGQRLLLSRGVIRPQVGRKYAVGLTPGYHHRHDTLGGNVDHRSRAWVNRWRNAYIRERVRQSVPSGFAQYNFTQENNDPEHMLDAVRAAALGASLIHPAV